MLQRLGTALTLIGLIILVVFAITFSAGQADLLNLLAGAGLAIAGLALRRRGAPPPAPPARFRAVRRALGREVSAAEIDTEEDE